MKQSKNAAPSVDGIIDEASLQAENKRLHAEVARLQSLLDSHGISYAQPMLVENGEVSSAIDYKDNLEDVVSLASVITKKSPHPDKANLFLSTFHGRDDVYARQWQSKEGKIGYSPVCKNEWQRGLCGKPKQKCASCPNAAYFSCDTAAVEAHLRGKCVLGIYPLRKDDTCAFLAIDFDEDDWKRGAGEEKSGRSSVGLARARIPEAALWILPSSSPWARRMKSKHGSVTMAWSSWTSAIMCRLSALSRC